MASRVLALTVVCFLVIVASTQVRGYIWPKQNTYSTRWDKVNIDDILDSTRLLQYYFKCLMGTGPCPPDGQELKRVLPEALETACAKCTKSQMEGAAKVIRFLRENRQDEWDQLCGKYDPDGKYRQKYIEPSPDNNTA
ncbi:ejaculatory bulb-specific protein 3-like [Neodiprion pinetum]|uniref:Ejaculatory bulb-specific protein 3 n=1 Tax=Neodiprion lecontei TaxID=441921 RepID=A0A6J0BP57_NEOLC|nr:ejaculatory bulb-specific protein 3 [Neodiprion lecontei]XP_046428040.1 ejaculatory bulb-specific protein 3-like [Neodiprion fabricii]XP_046465230.1 ejaculatory bulb-specific protein 3-like [Neodiprion pinetum]XP_046623970.1 ejaculatory bulb-specific protein 3-like [Neodiprion virginianus]